MVIKWPSKFEWVVIGITVLGVAAQFTDHMSPKTGSLVLLFWIAAKTFLNITGQSCIVQHVKEVSDEARGSVEVLTAKKAEPVDPKR